MKGVHSTAWHGGARAALGGVCLLCIGAPKRNPPAHDWRRSAGFATGGTQCRWAASRWAASSWAAGDMPGPHHRTAAGAPMSAWTRRSRVQCSSASRPLLLPWDSTASSSSACSCNGCDEAMGDHRKAKVAGERDTQTVHLGQHSKQLIGPHLHGTRASAANAGCAARMCGLQAPATPAACQAISPVHRAPTVTALVPSMGPKVCRKAQAVSSAPPWWREGEQGKNTNRLAEACGKRSDQAGAQHGRARCKCITAHALRWQRSPHLLCWQLRRQGRHHGHVFGRELRSRREKDTVFQCKGM